MNNLFRSTKTIAYEGLVDNNIFTIGDLSKLQDSHIENMFRDQHGNAKNKAIEYRNEAIMALSVSAKKTVLWQLVTLLQQKMWRETVL